MLLLVCGTMCEITLIVTYDWKGKRTQGSLPLSPSNVEWPRTEERLIFALTKICKMWKSLRELPHLCLVAALGRERCPDKHTNITAAEKRMLSIRFWLCTPASPLCTSPLCFSPLCSAKIAITAMPYSFTF